MVRLEGREVPCPQLRVKSGSDIFSCYFCRTYTLLWAKGAVSYPGLHIGWERGAVPAPRTENWMSSGLSGPLGLNVRQPGPGWARGRVSPQGWTFDEPGAVSARGLNIWWVRGRQSNRMLGQFPSPPSPLRHSHCSVVDSWCRIVDNEWEAETVVIMLSSHPVQESVERPPCGCSCVVHVL